MASKSKSKQMKLDKMLSASEVRRSRSSSTESEKVVSKKKLPSSSRTTSESENDSKTNKATSSKSIGNIAPVFAHSLSALTESPLVDELSQKRAELYESVEHFKFNKKRVRVLSDAMEIPENSSAILYWMSREQRVQDSFKRVLTLIDNWSLLYAQKLALKQSLPLLVCFSLVPTHLGATLRHYYFMIEGLKEVEKELRDLGIAFVLLIGLAKDTVPEFVKKHKIGGLVVDFCPLRTHTQWVNDVKKGLPSEIPMAQVDSHNIVPVWHASEKLEYSARTIRNKINSKLDEYLTEFPPLVSHPHTSEKTKEFVDAKIDWTACYESLKCDKEVRIVEWAKPGYKAGIKVLDEFIKNRLRIYDEDRNDPNKSALSNLSPWYHFGQISVQRCILEVKKYSSKCSKSVAAYMEETIVRRELAENFCYYQPNYDKIEGAYDWAKKTLADHAKDKRPNLYTLEDLDNFRTHDKLWNAAQIQMRIEGKMHGFLRMYWAKKILEWTESPEQALQFSIYLNDRYQLDGRETAGYVGCMWSICGIHDQGWAERAVFGKIRYMNYEGCKRKFDIDRFILKYNSLKNKV